ncbi:DUF418 domain-containing protein [Auritidibacter sp. NML120636]|uniref:DUF418 domain-containing protein n=1 Tax=Auritidibacter sp. NML120636 TaxID=2170743 RepID=UPI0011B23FBE|nr:DUF418 domain-containing protein [Auritidibacter sp. NML120636]
MLSFRSARTLITPPRVPGLDVARALAIIGMIFAHMALIPELEISEPSTWPGIVHGFSSLLFALLAGISLAMMTGGTRRPDIEALPFLRLRLLGRAAIIFGIGLALEALGTPISVILPIFGMLYIAMMPFMRLRRRWLLVWASGFAIIGPVVLEMLNALSAFDGALAFLFFSPYPLTAWLALALTGMAIGRSNLRSIRLATVLALGGLVVAALGFFLASLTEDGAGTSLDEKSYSSYGSIYDSTDSYGYVEDGSFYPYDTEDSSSWKPEDVVPEEEPVDPVEWLRLGLTSSRPHTGGSLEIMLGLGVGATVLGACLLICRGPVRWVTYPLSAMGAMPLTVYAAHAVVTLIVYGNINLGDWIGPAEEDLTALFMVIGALIVCPLWMAVTGRGPLESLTRHVGRLATGELHRHETGRHATE